MRRVVIPRYGLFVLLAALIVTGCITDPEKKETPTNDPVEFKDLTSKEDVITNMLLSHRERNIEEYAKLLLKPEDTYNGSTYADGYYWYNQEGNEGLPEFDQRDDDIAATGNLFLAANGTPAKPDHLALEDLTLFIPEGSWSPVAEIFGEPCEDCWFTERSYYIELTIAPGESIHGHHDVQFYIVPVDEGDLTIYKIAVAKDVFVP